MIISAEQTMDKNRTNEQTINWKTKTNPLKIDGKLKRKCTAQQDTVSDQWTEVLRDLRQKMKKKNK